jgi:hypothetical protein
MDIQSRRTLGIVTGDKSLPMRIPADTSSGQFLTESGGAGGAASTSDRGRNSRRTSMEAMTTAHAVKTAKTDLSKAALTVTEKLEVVAHRNPTWSISLRRRPPCPGECTA